MIVRWWGVVAPVIFIGSLALAQKPAPPAADIGTVLKAHCLACHSGAEKQGGFTLDSPLMPAQGKELLRRVRGEGGKPRMPLGFAPLAKEKIEALEKWVAAGTPKPTENQGAKHWAFQPVIRPLEPPIDGDASGIDAFVRARLEKEGLPPAPRADKTTLIRRATLDLTGLPPTPAEVDAFLADMRPDAYEKLVDRLLQSHHYGERMALPWLDAARYADSNGFQQDGDTYQYVWRDWVVKAFNQNKPFDEFTMEQIAGDLLPGATIDQQVATGFNRCHLLNGEGGAIPEEQRNVILFDRVDVTATTFLGVTLACAQCHDHKYDPLSQKDYYKFLAYFNNVPETGTPPGGGQYRIAEPFVTVETPVEKAQKITLEARLSAAKSEIARAEAQMQPVAPVALSTWRATSTDGPEHPEWTDGTVQPLTLGDGASLDLFRTITVATETNLPLSLGSDDGLALRVNGELVLEKNVQRGAAADQENVTVSLKPGANQLVLKITNIAGPSGFYFRADLPATPEVRAAREKVAALIKSLAELKESTPKVMVMSDARPRKTFLYERGQYLAPRDEVLCGTPAALTLTGSPRTGGGGGSANRLALARWLVSRENPLTARVFVNRIWQQFFGVGLVKTSENFGKLGEKPSHPELLDWLSDNFMQDWNIKNLVRQILTSETYKQSSKVTPALYTHDPENRLLARGARFRLPSLILRDVALSASGLLNEKIGGKPVYPYQPKGIWDGLSITKERDFTYPQSTGPDLYRRSLYTFWRRTAAPGNMFDASSRQACKVRAGLTSTPLHALTTLNDITWVEASRALAQKLIKETPEQSRLTEAFRRICARRPSEKERQILQRSFQRNKIAYELDPDSALSLLAVGDSPRDKPLDPAEHAALASVCLSLFNLDEALTKE